MDNNYATLKQVCQQACHERHACSEGYVAMLNSDNVSQMMATWRKYWDDVVRSKYVEVIRREFPALYASLRQEINEAGIYLNECPEHAKEFVRVIVTDCRQPVHIYGEASAYVLGETEVVAHDNAVVHNEQFDASVSLRDHSFGTIKAGRVDAHDWSIVKSISMAILYDHAACVAYGGTVKALGYKSITAHIDKKVYSFSQRNIKLYDKAVRYPLTDLPNDEITHCNKSQG